MRPLALPLVTVTVAGAMCVVFVAASAGGAPREQREGTIDGGALACVGVHTYVRYVPYGYNHIVALTNDCAADVLCDVSTDVNPATLSVDVAAGTTSEVVTFKGSPRTTFVANVACTRR